MGNAHRSQGEEENDERIADVHRSTSTTERRSISQLATTTVQNVSQASFQKSKVVAHNVGSFFGLTQKDSNIDQWKEKFEMRAKEGGVGFHVDNLIPNRRTKADDIKQLESNVKLVSAEREVQETQIRELSDVALKDDEAGNNVSSVRFIAQSGQTEKVAGSSGVVYKQSKCSYLSSAVADNENRGFFSRIFRGSAASKSNQGKSRENEEFGAKAYQDDYDIAGSSNGAKPRSKSAHVSSVNKSQDSTVVSKSASKNSEFPEDPDEQGKSSESSKLTFQPDYLYKAEGLQHYQNFVTKERLEKKVKLDEQKNNLEAKIQTEQQILVETIEASRELERKLSGVTADDITLDEWPPRTRPQRLLDQMRKLLCFDNQRIHIPDGSQARIIQKQLEERKQYKPWFIYTISTLQVLIFVILISVGNIAPVGLEPELQLQRYTRTFRGLETVEHWEIKNLWIGPSIKFLIAAGAAFAPCMRDDKGIKTLLADYSDDEIGCCEFIARITAGTTTEQECVNATGGVAVWTRGLMCSQRNRQTNPTPQVIKPCCYGIRGQCKMTSADHCEALKGHFHHDVSGPEHCSQVNCMSNICGFGGIKTNPDQPYLPFKPNQFWRIFLPILYHQGFVQLVISVGSQLIIGRPIEALSGHLRIAIIYFVSGMMSLFFGSMMSPYSPQVGATGAIFGLLGVLTVELTQSWKLIENPGIEIGKIVAVVIFFFFTGTFPLVNNFVMVAGFLYGIIISIAILPYITFGRWDVQRRRVLMAIVIPVLAVFIILEFVLFYVVQPFTPYGCKNGCEYLNCIPYTNLVCKADELW